MRGWPLHTVWLLAVASAAACAQTGTSSRKWETLPLSSIIVKNQVSKCLQVRPSKIEVTGSIAKLTAEGSFSSSTGDCGCTSALLSYKVAEARAPGHSIQWVSALVSARSSSAGATRQFDFVLSSDATVPVTGPVTLSIACAPHE